MNKIEVNKLSPEDWAMVLRWYDELFELTESVCHEKMASVDLTPEAKHMLQQMLANSHTNSILDKTIDPLIEDLLGHDALHPHAIPAHIVGRTFGAWKVIDVLASGGMGQVFLAERADGQFEKQVALKIIKSGQFSTLSQQRFLEEMRTLAQLEHPHIARLIDGGNSDENIAYFVMELVHGAPICEYANLNALNLNDRISLVIQAIEAVEFAHQSLIIHGDIKPANILVNDAGQVKLVDFGIARPLEAQDSTDFLPQFTPSYASPEQAQGKPLSTASDVFGLSAVLFELCTGCAPRSQATTTTEIDYIEQTTAPIAAAYQRFKNNQNQQINHIIGEKPGKLDRALSRELGAIIDKGLKIETAQRYRNTTELRRDLQSFVAGDPVATYSQQSLYRWRKAVANHKWPVFISGMALLGIVGFAVVAMQQAKLARDETAKAQWANQFLLSIFAAADPVKNQKTPISVNELTGMAANKILEDDSDIHLKADSLELLSQIQHRLGEVESAGLLNTEQIKLLEKFPDNQQQLAEAHINAGQIMVTLNDFEQSTKHFKLAMDLVPLEQAVNQQSVNAAMGMADSLIRFDQEKAAEKIVEDLVDNEATISMLNNKDLLMATLYMLKAKLAKAYFAYDQALSDITVAKSFAIKVTDNAMLYPEVLGIESDVYFERGESTKAEVIDRQLVAYFKDKFGATHPETIDSLSNLAVSLLTLGKIKESIAVNLEIIASLQLAGITDHQEAASYLNLGIAYDILGEYQKALDNLKLAEAMWPTLTPRYLYYDALTYVSMARTFLTLNQLDLAELYFDKGLTTLAEENGVDHHRYAWFQVKYVALLLAQGKLTEAELILPNAHQKIVDVYGVDGKRTALADIRWAQLNAALGHQQQAAVQAAKALKVLDLPHVRHRYPAEIAVAKQLVKQSKIAPEK
ncbi:serine/threonine-protein kinase [Marinicella litoralis]|uniref:Serine/threonine protein kinase n=1 Tax=Marinicella litoralis TaxID=644220 RepID=A0A4R6XVQ4_9GAMM|nr:serine/threonine-protein kinase [Marinicella litoralis]TDR20548.1 serine/threonine protein kinase [Marinicella litoralis]